MALGRAKALPAGAGGEGQDLASIYRTYGETWGLSMRYMEGSMSLLMGNACGRCGSPHGAQGRTHGSVQGLHGGKMWVPLWVQREVASGLFVK